VSEFVLRGIVLLRKQEIDWFYQRGVDAIFPDAWKDFLAPIPLSEPGGLLHAYYNRLASSDPNIQRAAATAWSVWEGTTSCLYPNPEVITRSSGEMFSLARSRIECHYFVNGAFVEQDGELLANVDRIRTFPP
jgi:proline iminopeptidase